MKEMQNEIKKKYNITSIYPLVDIILKKSKISLFYNEYEGVNYSLYTDGNLEHIGTWLDKWPYQKDPFLDKCGRIKRFDFLLTKANFIFFDKTYDLKKERILYIDFANFDKIVNDRIYNVSITEKENIKIKRLEL